VISPLPGARVVSLRDRRTGREWLAQARSGEPPVTDLASEEAVFGAAEAFGWDECLPTIARCPDPLDPRAPLLRDHGDSWGREASISDQGTALATEWPAGRWGLRFSRRLRLDSSAVIAEYAATNPGPRPVPLLWAAHPLLQLEPGTRLHVPRVDRMRVEHSKGLDGIGGQVGWPRAMRPDGSTLELDVVAPVEAATALKLFARGVGGRAGALAPDRSWIGLAWDTTFAPFLGVWLDYGGWPRDAPLHQVALEPTTAPTDSLSDAVSAGQAPAIGPGRTLRWWLRLELGTEPHGLGAFLRG
jgi:hypothetical protein